LESLTQGSFGDTKSVGDGVRELRVHVGPGYRVYFAQTGKIVLLLLCGGDKSTQKKDIDKAKRLLREIRED
jgi:putative addiction module killer protein